MKQRISLGCAALFIALSLATATPSAGHEGHHHNAMGTVHKVEPNSLELADKDGKLQSFELSATTTYKRGDDGAKQEDLKVGDRAVVMYEVKEGKNMAIEVKLSTAAAHEGHHDGAHSHGGEV